MTEFMYELKIPKDRIAVLIGKDGEVKQELEEQTKTSIMVDSKEGDVRIQGEDSVGLFCTREIVKAIGRGFNPKTALDLLKPEYNFDLINLRDYVTKEHLPRVKGRIIGTKGKARRTIEELTETRICVYGKTIGIIGEVGYVSVARRAIEMLLEGSRHATVYKWLEKKRRAMKRNEMIGEE
jgi:ribosomal RNA assembly protein